MKTRLMFAVVVALIAAAIAERLGWIELPRLSGPEAWISSRAAGVTAFGALTLDVVFGLFVSTGVLDRMIPRGASVDLHKWLSGVALTLVAIHALALLGDATVMFDAIDLLVPGSSSYRPVAVGLGIGALYAAAIVHASFGWRKRIGIRAWRALHVLAFAVWGGALAHGLTAGTDAGTSGMRVVYLGAATIVGSLIVLRIALRAGFRSGSAAPRGSARG